MKPAVFEYHAARTVDEAVQLLVQYGLDDGRIIAGGQSLVPTMAYRMARPRHLIDINGIESLKRIEVKDGKLRIGAVVRHAAFERPVVRNPVGHLLSEVVKHIAHRPIRTRGTFCGSIAHADPASEWCAVAALLDAEMLARNTHGSRTITAVDYFLGMMTTALAEDELLVEVHLPLLPDDTRFGFKEFNRRAGDFAIAMALVTYSVKGDAIIDARVGIGGVEAVPRRLAEAEMALNGKPAIAATFLAAAQVASAVVDPIEDHHNSADYRRELVEFMVSRALEQAASRTFNIS